MASESRTPQALSRALDAITVNGLISDIRVFSSDRYEGRAPGTRSEDSSVAYISSEFQRIGLKPGNPNGRYIQVVPLVGTTSHAQASATVGGKQTELRQLDDIVAWSMRPEPSVKVRASELVFVGYGIVAPEFGWDDYKGIDVRGKTIVMLVGDPPVPPRRTLIFMAVTGEEQGLLGSRYYSQHPLYPLERTLADINMDIMNPSGRTHSIISIGFGQTTLEDLLSREAAAQGRTVKPDPEPEKGYFYRADHFELARHGVPALAFLFPGTDYVGKPVDYGQRVRTAYVTNDYHKPSDEIKPDWDLSGAVEDTRLLFRTGLDVANGNEWPTWNTGTEFRARREQMLRSGGHEQQRSR